MDGTELSTNEGRVEYCYNNGWAPVCSLNSYAANLMCKSLGFTQFTWGSIVSDERYGRSDITSDFNYLYCNSNHHSLSDCYTYTKGSGSCYITQSTCSTEYGLRCFNPGSCTDGQLRLYNGTIQQEGRAEVCINGVWSAICQYGFNTIDAYVFCASLGYTGGHPTIYYTATFGETNGPIAWSYLYCYGWEQSVFDCSKSQYPYFTCSYPNTVGITCKEGMMVACIYKV
jgi:deleted-in-malignant-brain-tumors protein 1